MSPILAREPTRTFTPCPEGLHHAVCVDVVDLGVLNTSFGDKHKIRIVWQIEEEQPDNGRRYDVRAHYNLSLHEKARLRKDLESWRGRKFSPEELGGFDLERLLKANCQIQVVHDLGDDGRVWANVQAVVPAPKNVPALAPVDYVRQQDRPKDQGNGHASDEDSVPF